MKLKKHIHFVGVKGVGMAPLAIIAKEAGCVVTGCDIADDFITDEALLQKGIKPLVGFSATHLENEKVDMVITTGAHGGFDNPEVKAAKEKGIPVLTQGEAVGIFMNGEIFGKKQLGISVAGSHGKTTTTAMLATVFTENKLDPSFVIGTGSVPSLGSPGHYGRGKYFIAEADEYATEPQYDKTIKFLWHHPKIAIITNIELDHTDVHPSLDAMRESFLQFVKQLPLNGVLITCGDDPQVQKLLNAYEGKKITYGYGNQNDFVIKRVHVSFDQTFFWLESGTTSLGEWVISVTGEHNALNATAVIIASLETGIPLEKIKKGLRAFTGSKRRSEFIATLPGGAMLFDDYAHHPTEIQTTLSTFRKRFPKSHIVCIFQPHTYSRTKAFFNEFIHAFSASDTVIISNIYASLREKPDLSVSSQLLVEKMHAFHKNALFLPALPDVIEYVNQKHYGKDTIVITMGAGDIYKIAAHILKP